MKTTRMQKQLEDAAAQGQIIKGESYHLLPSDCSGDGYDIAMSSRPDESGDYTIRGHVARVVCSIRTGSKDWHKGTPALYTLDYAPKAPYRLQHGERAIVRERTGTSIGPGYMARTMASIVIIRADGKDKRKGRLTYWLGTTHVYASHYKSGRSRADERSYQAELARLRAIADQINAGE